MIRFWHRIRVWWYRRQLRKLSTRLWTAHNPFGFAEVGWMSRDKAIKTVGAWGRVTFVDDTNGIIFYDTHMGRDNSYS